MCRDAARDSGMMSAELPLNATISIDDWRVLWRVLWRVAADSKAMAISTRATRDLVEVWPLLLAPAAAPASPETC